MRLMVLLVTAILACAPVHAQTPSSSSAAKTASGSQDAKPNAKPGTLNPEPGTRNPASETLPVSLEKIRGALERPPRLSLRTLDERPTFRVQILERQRIEELLATLNFKSSSPAPAGGLYGYEQQRQMWNPVDHPMMQPFAAFNQGELLTLALENLIGKYVLGPAITSIKNARQTSAGNAAREEVRQAIVDYCAAQPRGGAGIDICETSSAFAR